MSSSIFIHSSEVDELWICIEYCTRFLVKPSTIHELSVTRTNLELGGEFWNTCGQVQTAIENPTRIWGIILGHGHIDSVRSEKDSCHKIKRAYVVTSEL